MIDIVVRESAKADVLALCLGPDGPLVDGVPDGSLPGRARTAVAIFAAESGPAGRRARCGTSRCRRSAPAVSCWWRSGPGSPPICAPPVPGWRAARGAEGSPWRSRAPGRSSRCTDRRNRARFVPIHPASTAPRPIGASRRGGAGTGRGRRHQEAIDRARTLAAATVWARDLANARSSVKTPDWLGRQAAAILTPLGVRVDVYDETWLAAQGFGGVLAVGAGSRSPPRLIQAAWRPRNSGSTHLVIIGKGITFDSGGLNLKPGDSMRTMYTDMAGAAAALGALAGGCRPPTSCPAHRSRSRCREQPVRLGDAPERRHPALRRPDDGGAEHGRRRPPGAR